MSDILGSTDNLNKDIQTENFICPSCGSVLKYDIKKDKFLCISCGYEGIIDTVMDRVVEYDFNDYYTLESMTVPFDGLACTACRNCGAEIVFDPNETAKVCPMCASTQIATVKQNCGIPPHGIVTFKIDKNDAAQKFKGWVNSRWFAPNKFKKAYQEGGLSGSYIPFWTYDASVVAHYIGQGGTRHTSTDSKGNTTTTVSWSLTSGVVSENFDDIQICASNSSSADVIKGVLPYDTVGSIKPYSPAYLSGYRAELYSIKADVGFIEAEQIIEAELRSLATSQILARYDEARVSSIMPKYSNVTYKHVLLPVWSAVFAYSDKTYKYVINGETGKVNGERPYSVPKIAAAVISVLLIVIAIFYFSEKSDATFMSPIETQGIEIYDGDANYAVHNVEVSKDIIEII